MRKIFEETAKGVDLEREARKTALLDFILNVPLTQDVTLFYKQREAFCDLLGVTRECADYAAIRRASYILGIPVPAVWDRGYSVWLDEIPRLWIGQRLNRDWFIPQIP